MIPKLKCRTDWIVFTFRLRDTFSQRSALKQVFRNNFSLFRFKNETRIKFSWVLLRNETVMQFILCFIARLGKVITLFTKNPFFNDFLPDLPRWRKLVEVLNRRFSFVWDYFRKWHRLTDITSETYFRFWISWKIFFWKFEMNVENKFRLLILLFSYLF